MFSKNSRDTGPLLFALAAAVLLAALSLWLYLSDLGRPPTTTATGQRPRTTTTIRAAGINRNRIVRCGADAADSSNRASNSATSGR